MLKKMFSIKSLYMPDIVMAAENGVMQHPGAFQIDVKNLTHFEGHLL
jgi:hypothetical protein